MNRYEFENYKRKWAHLDLAENELWRKFYIEWSDRLIRESITPINTITSNSQAGGALRRVDLIQEDANDENLDSLPICLYNLDMTESQLLDLLSGFGIGSLDEAELRGIIDFESETNVYSFEIDSNDTKSLINASSESFTFPLDNAITFEYKVILPQLTLTPDFNMIFHSFGLLNLDILDLALNLNFGFINGNYIAALQSQQGTQFFDDINTDTITVNVTILPNKTIRINANFMDEAILSNLGNVDEFLLVSFFEYENISDLDFGKIAEFNLITDYRDFSFDYVPSTDLCGSQLPDHIDLVPSDGICDLTLSTSEEFLNLGYSDFDVYDEQSVTKLSGSEPSIAHTIFYNTINFDTPRAFEVTNNISSENLFFVGLNYNGIEINDTIALAFINNRWNLFDQNIIFPLFGFENINSNVGFYIDTDGQVGVVIDGNNLGWYNFTDNTLVENKPTGSTPLTTNDFRIVTFIFPSSPIDGSETIEIVEKGNSGYPIGVRNWCGDPSSESDGNNSNFVEIIIPEDFIISEANPDEIFFTNDNIYKNLIIESLTVAFGITVDFNTALVNIISNSLTSVGSIYIAYNDVLSNVSLPSLIDVTGNLTISWNDNLFSIDLNGLTNLGGSLNINSNPNLIDLLLDDLENITGNITINGNTNLSTLNFPNLNEFGTSMQLMNNNLSPVSVSNILVHLSQNTTMNNRTVRFDGNGVNISLLSTQALDAITDLNSRGWNIIGL